MDMIAQNKRRESDDQCVGNLLGASDKMVDSRGE